MDRHGVWHPRCDLARCNEPQAVDGIVTVLVFLGAEFTEARIQVCAGHRDELAPQADTLCNVA